jgi:hypothetical protein
MLSWILPVACRDPGEIRALTGVYVEDGVLRIGPCGDVPVHAAAADSSESAVGGSEGGARGAADAASGTLDTRDDPGSPVEIAGQSREGGFDDVPELIDSSDDEGASEAGDVGTGEVSDGWAESLQSVRQVLRGMFNSTKRELIRKADARKRFARRRGEARSEMRKKNSFRRKPKNI